MHRRTKLFGLIGAALLLSAPTFPTGTVNDPEHPDFNPLITAPVIEEPEEEEPEDTGPTEEELQQEERRVRALGFENTFQSNTLHRNSFREFRAKRRESLKGLRVQCRQDIRMSNSLTEVGTALDCYRKDLTMELDILKRQERWLGDIAGVSDEVRENAVGALQELMGALEALQEGIDRDVIPTMAALKEADTNLTDQYWLPYWDALLRLRAYRAGTWIAHLLTLFGDSEELLVGEETLDAQQIVQCLKATEEPFLGVLAEENYEAARDQISQAQLQAKSCTAPVTALAKPTAPPTSAIIESPENKYEGIELSPRRKYRP